MSRIRTGAFACMLWCAAGGVLAGPIEVRVPTSSGFASFVVEDASGAACAAARLCDEHASKAGRVPGPRQGYELSDRLVISGDPRVILNALDRAGADLRGVMVDRLESMPGLSLLSAGSVARAAELAGALSGRFEVVEMDMVVPFTLRAPNDPFFLFQWHLRNTADPSADINADVAWDLGYTGSGVTIGIVEIGFVETHEDLAPNFDATASQAGGIGSGHTTSVAGVAAARGDNGIGVAGLAYNATLSQQLIGSGVQTGQAFLFRNDLNDIKNNSWGPPDDGTIHTMSAAERNGLRSGVMDGRGGLGVIYTWAAGNGGLNDRCDYDPYASSRYTLCIGSVGDANQRADYNETGSCMTVVTHSSGNTRGITTTTPSGYTSGFGGTSSASPLGAGAVALMLEARPDLTWRDVQHLLIDNAWKVDPGNEGWTTNGAGRDINYNFGFGAIDVGAAVVDAMGWSLVGPEVSITSGVVPVNESIPDDDATGMSRTISIGEQIRVESVELRLNVATTAVGDLRVWMRSPDGTQSIFAEPRADGTDNYMNYVFTSLRHWDELSDGDWTVFISDEEAGDSAQWLDVQLTAYGTSTCVPDIAPPFGTLDIFDAIEFMDWLSADDMRADFAAPFGTLDAFDMIAYFGLFDGGCP